MCCVSGCEAEQFDFTAPPDYDYSATFNYSFYSRSHTDRRSNNRSEPVHSVCLMSAGNASYDDLDKFSQQFEDQDEEETVTKETAGGTAESHAVSLQLSQVSDTSSCSALCKGRFKVSEAETADSASLCICLLST